jgi:hypothetical protein
VCLSVSASRDFIFDLHKRQSKMLPTAYSKEKKSVWEKEKNCFRHSVRATSFL